MNKIKIQTHATIRFVRNNRKVVSGYHHLNFDFESNNDIITSMALEGKKVSKLIEDRIKQTALDHFHIISKQDKILKNELRHGGIDVQICAFSYCI